MMNKLGPTLGSFHSKLDVKTRATVDELLACEVCMYVIFCIFSVILHIYYLAVIVHMSYSAYLVLFCIFCIFCHHDIWLIKTVPVSGRMV